MNRKKLSVLCLLASLAVVLPLPACASNNTNTVTQDVKETASGIKEATGEALKDLGETLDDTSITTAVKAKILATKGLDSLDISVTTRDHVVYLTGMVESQAQVTLAEQVAAEVKGVTQVVNKLSVFKK